MESFHNSFKNVDLCSYSMVTTLFPAELCASLFEFRRIGMQFWGEYQWILSDYFLCVLFRLYLMGSIGLFFVVDHWMALKVRVNTE